MIMITGTPSRRVHRRGKTRRGERTERDTDRKTNNSRVKRAALLTLRRMYGEVAREAADGLYLKKPFESIANPCDTYPSWPHSGVSSGTALLALPFCLALGS
jgi:hypothetical protein